MPIGATASFATREEKPSFVNDSIAPIVLKNFPIEAGRHG